MLKTADVWVVAACSPVKVYRRFTGAYFHCHRDDCLDGGTVSTSETSVDFFLTTRRKNPENSHLPTRRREISHRIGLLRGVIKIFRLESLKSMH
jgi:hypothetical protein